MSENKSINNSDLDESEYTEESEYDSDDNDIVTPEFIEKVVKFVKYDDLIRKKKEEIKELKKQMNPFDNFILNCLINNDRPLVDIADGELRKVITVRKQPLKIDDVTKVLEKKLDNEKLRDEILKDLDNRQIKSKTALKRVILKKKCKK